MADKKILIVDDEKDLVETLSFRLKANDDIDKLSKVRSDFVSIISHELRTPLTSVKESISLVLDGIAGPVTDDQKKFLSMAKNNIDRLASVVIDVLDFSKLDSGRITMHKKKTNINVLIKDIYESYRGFVEKRDLTFELSLSDKIVATWFDPKRIDQAIRNLLSNAVKFNKDKGKVMISSAKELIEGKEVIKVIVEDTGVGIPKEDISKLFKQFSPLDTTMTRDYKGVGIGLAICKRILGYHAGDIWIESKKGIGTKAIFTLPIYKRDSEFNFLLDEAIERAMYADLELSLILFKIKNSKDDTEENLSDIEKIMKSIVRGPEDKVTRFKGGKCVAMMAGANRYGAMKIIERLKAQVKLSLNYGMAVFPDDVEDKVGLIGSAEEDLKGKKNTI